MSHPGHTSPEPRGRNVIRNGFVTFLLLTLLTFQDRGQPRPAKQQRDSDRTRRPSTLTHWATRSSKSGRRTTLTALPRAYLAKSIDERLRLRAYRQLQEMRIRLRKPHINAGWSNGPRGPSGNPMGGGNAGPGTTGPGGCAWTTSGPTNING